MSEELRRLMEAILYPDKKRRKKTVGGNEGPRPAEPQPAPEPEASPRPPATTPPEVSERHAEAGEAGGVELPVPGDTLVLETPGEEVVAVEEASPPPPRPAVEAPAEARVETPLGPADVLSSPASATPQRFVQDSVVDREGWRVEEVLVDWGGAEVAAVLRRGVDEYLLVPRRRGLFDEARLVEAGFVPVYVEAGGGRRRVYAGVFGRLIDVNLALCAAAQEQLIVRRGGEEAPLC